MAEFKIIETQEELDRIITERLKRNKESVTAEVTKQYEGYLSPDEVKKLNDQVTALTAQLTEKDTSIADLTAKNKAYENASVKARIAHEKGLPYELAERLSGETEEEITADADILAKFVSDNKDYHVAPLYDAGSGKNASNETDAALLEALKAVSSE